MPDSRLQSRQRSATPSIREVDITILSFPIRSRPVPCSPSLLYIPCFSFRVLPAFVPPCLSSFLFSLSPSPYCRPIHPSPFVLPPCVFPCLWGCLFSSPPCSASTRSIILLSLFRPLYSIWCCLLLVHQLWVRVHVYNYRRLRLKHQCSRRYSKSGSDLVVNLVCVLLRDWYKQQREKQTDGQTGRWMDGWTDRQRGQQTDSVCT